MAAFAIKRLLIIWSMMTENKPAFSVFSSYHFFYRETYYYKRTFLVKVQSSKYSNGFYMQDQSITSRLVPLAFYGANALIKFKTSAGYEHCGLLPASSIPVFLFYEAEI